MKRITVGANDKEQRLDKFLQKLLPDAPQSVIYKSLRKKRIKCNSKRVTDGATRLQEGDVLELYINDDFFAKDNKKAIWQELIPILEVVYEDEHIIVMKKTSGMPSQGGEDEVSLEAHMRAYLYNKGEYNPEKENSFLPSLCHRIDRNTSGLVIGAKDAESLRVLNQKVRDKEIRKFYLCEVEGELMPDKGEISGWLLKEEKTRKMIFSDKQIKGASECRTRYKVLKGGEVSLVEAELLTGRTHQIRASFSHIGHPLVGDVKYGAKKTKSKDFQHLVSYRLIFDFSTDSGCLEYLKGREIKI